jgi:poly(hydroxyalkanoate) depolymerase family esterase
MAHSKNKLAQFLASSTHFFRAQKGVFLSGTFPSGAGPYPYKLYIPHTYSRGTPTPLLVALHGCTQDPDNFAAGTRFNELADAYNFLILYPQQTNAHQPRKCWSWYDPAHQVRGRGEPAVIVGMVDYVKSQYTIDTDRIFVTGMSAGGAMAVIVGVCYPDYFAAVGVHSGLEYNAASDLISAQQAMINGGPDPAIQAKLAYQSAGQAARVLPAIVFQGNNDYTVYPINGDQVMQQFVRMAYYVDGDSGDSSIGTRPGSIQKVRVPNLYSYTISNYVYKGQVLWQKYTIDTLGHAWSGGSTAAPATFTDPGGPDASRIMWNFFAKHPKVTITSSSQGNDDIIEGVFRYLPDEADSGPSSPPTVILIPPRTSTSSSSSSQSVTVTLYSIGSEDGYVMNNFPYNNDLSVGYLAGTQQFGFASFDTSCIPANAVIESVTLKMTRNYASAGNAFGKLGRLVVDIKGGNGFGGSPALHGNNGTDLADASAVCTMSIAAQAGAISEGSVAASAFQYINRTGRTQFRFRFTIVSAGSYSTDYVGFFGGEMTNAPENRPQMVITYHE